MNTFKKIVIDPGHGGDDNGAVWGFAKEDAINLIIAYLLRCELEKASRQGSMQAGHDVMLTRVRDVSVSLEERVEFANTLGADLFISIHCDAFHNSAAGGISTHIYLGASTISNMVGERIQAELMKRFPGHKDRGVRLSNFYVLRQTIMPAVLVECEFLSNPETRRFLREPENQHALAVAIAAGITI